MLTSENLLDPVVLLVACRRLGEAEELARERVSQMAKAAAVDRLAKARAAKALADILLEGGKTEAATPHVLEARRLYRPFRNDAALSAEVDLTLAQHAAHDRRTLEAEEILSEATARAADVPGAEVASARLWRYAAHLQIIRWEIAKGDAMIGEALRAVQRAASAARGAGASGSAEVSLLLSQVLFTQGEVAFMRDDAARARASTEAALDVAETELRGLVEYVLFARARAAHAHRVFGDAARAEELEARAESRHG